MRDLILPYVVLVLVRQAHCGLSHRASKRPEE